MAAPTVTLRPLGPDDRDRLLIWRNSPEVAAYMFTDHQISPAEHARWFAGIAGDPRRAYWVIEVDGGPAGVANLYDIDPANRRGAWAFYLAEAAIRGKGVGGCTQYLVIEKAFGAFGLTEIRCEVLLSNQRASHLYRKFGFKEDASRRRQLTKNGVLEEAAELSLTAEDWAVIRPQILSALRAAGFVLEAGSAAR